MELKYRFWLSVSNRTQIQLKFSHFFWPIEIMLCYPFMQSYEYIDGTIRKMWSEIFERASKKEWD